MSELLRAFLALDSAAVSDALDGLRLPPGVGGLGPMWPGARMAGFAVTVQLGPVVGAGTGAHILTSVVAGAAEDDVIVVANYGRTDVSAWGGLLSLGASRRGVRGALVDGACRDVGQARELRFPVYARAAVPVTARGRLAQGSVGGRVSIRGVPVNQGDVVLADETGVVFVPRARAEEVLAAAWEIEAREAAIARELRAGASLPEVMRDARLAGTAEGDAR